MQVRACTSYEDLAFHALAHIPLRGPENLCSYEYASWCRSVMDRAAFEPLASDAPRLGAAIDASASGMAIQWLVRLHPSIEALLRTSRLDVADLGSGEDLDAIALTQLRCAEVESLELLRADLMLAARAYARWRGQLDDAVLEACDAVREMLELARELRRPAEVRLAIALGARGRGFGDRVIVGVPGLWTGLDAATPAVLALHEHAVVGERRDVTTGAPGADPTAAREPLRDYVRGEWTALTNLSRALLGAPRLEPLALAHQRWLAGLAFDDLVVAVQREGLVSAAVAQRLRDQPEERQRILAV